MQNKYFIIWILLVVCALKAQTQPANKTITLPSMEDNRKQWVDSIYNSLTLSQRIGQLFMVAAYSGGEKYNQPLIEKLIRNNEIGGLIFMQGTPSAQIEQTNIYQKISRVPLLIGMDAEWGLGMRLKGVKDFPRQLMLGAAKDSTLVYKMATAIAGQCRRMGVHIDFAPVIDVNNNSNNPVINFRSFGENKYKVANYGIQYMRGLQDNGIMACAKHFPGHGDTETDSHKDLPQINKSIEALEKLEFYPFKSLINNGIQSIMIAHLQIPALEKSTNTPSTLSYNTVTELLKNKMGFQGLIFTDALNMEGVAKFYQPGEIDLKAFKAGNDVLLFSQEVGNGLEKIKKAIQAGEISESRLEESVKKILRAKYDAGLNKVNRLSAIDVDNDLNQYTSSLRLQIAEASITLLNDPFQVLNKLKIKNAQHATYIAVGGSINNTFANTLKKYGIAKQFEAPRKSKEIKDFARRLKNAEMVVVGVHGMSGYPTQNFSLDAVEVESIKALLQNQNAIVVLFGNPYALKLFCDHEGFLVAYDESDETQQTTAQIIIGQLKAKGKLPVTVCEKYKIGDGIASFTNVLGEVTDSTQFARQNKSVESNDIRTKYLKDITLECCVNPLALGINNTVLDKLDDYLQSCVNQNVFPGCRVLAAKDGKVFYDKAFGYLTSDRRNPVDINTIYDIASITKVAATTLGIMKLYDDGQLNLNEYLGKYLPKVKGTDKEYLKIKDILLHQAGLKSWIPFYKETLDSTKHPRSDIYAKNESSKFPIKVCSSLYMRSDWIDTMWKRILYSPLENRGRYVYSDLDFILLQEVVERVTKKSLDEYLNQEFYKPLGMSSTAFNPRKKLMGKEIAPTEYDNYFRYQKIEGYVHDMGAAMFGGISGHAGLFSTPNDLGVLFQMLLNGGIYNGKRYLQKSTVEIFTSKQSSISRRALGFDKPDFSPSRGNPCADNVSSKTFGHTGFTGTCIWADPENGVLFIFLSNRTYPSADNKQIQRLNVREKAQSYIYTSMGIAPQSKK